MATVTQGEERLLKLRLVIATLMATIFVLAAPLAAPAALFTVVSTADTPDSAPADGICADASGACTLRAAIQQTNSLEGADAIQFAIPGGGVHTIFDGGDCCGIREITDRVTIDGTTQPGYSSAVPGKAPPVIELRGSPGSSWGLRVAGRQADGTIIRGLAIGGFGNADVLVGGSVPGSEVENVSVERDYIGLRPDQTVACGCPVGYGIVVDQRASRTTIRDSAIAGIPVAGILVSSQTTTISGNYLGTDGTGMFSLSDNDSIEILARPEPGSAPLVIGGVNASPGGPCTGDCNVISGRRGISISSPIPTVITGNYIGTNAAGSEGLVFGGGIFFTGQSAADVRIGGATAAKRNVIHRIVVQAARNVRITGNYVGTDATGTRRLGNGSGIAVEDPVTGVVIGGSSATPGACDGSCNLVSGNIVSGIVLNNGNGGVEIRGNFIGTDITGRSPLPNRSNGVDVGFLPTSSGNLIASNRIGFNEGAGVLVREGNTAVNDHLGGNRITENAIFGNGGLGIDLGCGSGLPFCRGVVNFNDPGDLDDGANDRQNWPVVEHVEVANGKTTVSGSLDARPGSYRLEFFRNAPIPGWSNTACYPSYWGQGLEFVGASTVQVTSGPTAYTQELPFELAPDEAITATATDAAGNTSEFSECLSDLAITKTDEPDPVAPGATVTYTLHVVNNGPAPSPRVVVWDQRPAGATLAAAASTPTPSQGSCAPLDRGRWRCELEALARGAEATVSVPLVPPASAASLKNVAWVGENEFFDTESGSAPLLEHDLVSANNRAEQTTTIGDPSATIVVRKATVPAGDATPFTFAGDVAGQLAGGGELRAPVMPGTYTTREVAKPGWDLASIGCDDTDSSSDVANASVLFRVEAGETVVCTFTNVKRGTLVVRKVTETAPDTDSTSFAFSADGGLQPASFALAAGGTQTFPDLPARNGYAVSETPVPGWALASATCDNGSSVTNIDIGPGVVVTCTFTNRRLGRIVVQKRTVPAGSVHSFGFSASFAPSAFTLRDNQSNTSEWLTPGQTYAVAESAVAGWEQTSATCDDGSAPTSIDVSPGETVTCTFVNTNRPPSVDADGPYSGIEGAATTIDGTATDPAGEALSSSWSVVPELGVDPAATCSITDPRALSASVLCTEEGVYTLTLTVDDGVNTPVSATTTLTVADAPLAAEGASLVTRHAFSGLVATFVDANPFAVVGDFTATVDWGDASRSAGTVSAGAIGFRVSGAHTYTAPGAYTIRTHIVDDGGSFADAQTSLIVYGFPDGGGAFVIGDKSAVVGAAVTFWGAQWWRLNVLSEGEAPAAFKGFAASPGTPVCGAEWNTDPGNGVPPPPGPLPSYMGVIVTSAVSNVGSAISGNTVRIVVVRLNGGYQPNAGHAGTGVVVTDAESCG